VPKIWCATCQSTHSTSFSSHRCAFHAYADSTYARHLESGGGPTAGAQSLYGTIGAGNHETATITGTMTVVDGGSQSGIEVSEDSINSIEKVEEWKVLANGNGHAQQSQHRPRMANGTPSPRENGKWAINWRPADKHFSLHGFFLQG